MNRCPTRENDIGQAVVPDPFPLAEADRARRLRHGQHQMMSRPHRRANQPTSFLRSCLPQGDNGGNEGSHHQPEFLLPTSKAKILQTIQ
ncbi:unnamed protein product [Urochloa humidicola]